MSVFLFLCQLHCFQAECVHKTDNDDDNNHNHNNDGFEESKTAFWSSHIKQIHAGMEFYCPKLIQQQVYSPQMYMGFR